MALRIEIDSLKEIDLKGSKGLRFNAILALEEGYVVIPGFRLLDGLISPPASRSKNHWYPNVYMKMELGQILYAALKKALAKRGFAETHTLGSASQALAELCDLVKTLKCAPFLVTKTSSSEPVEKKEEGLVWLDEDGNRYEE